MNKISFGQVIQLQNLLLSKHSFDPAFIHKSWSNYLRQSVLLDEHKFPTFVEHEGVPFVICKDHFGDNNTFCYINPFDSYYTFNAELHDKFADYNVKVSDFNIVSFPEGITFDIWLRKNNKTFASHFFGAKSQEICWTLVQQISPNDWGYLTEYTVKRQLEIEEKEQQRAIVDFNLCCGSRFFEDKGDFIIATDKNERIVCAMQVIKFRDCWIGGEITADRDEKYKPFSLIVCAQLAMIKYALENCVPKVDLGLNFSSIGDYKSIIPHDKVPMYNFPSFQRS